MVIATIFVSLPFVAREVVPTLREIGDEQEQAAHTLGAGPWQTFWRITLPSIRWAVIYGVVLTTARCLGEYGAVAVVSGNIEGKTETATLRVQDAYENFDLVRRVRHLARARRDLRHRPGRDDLSEAQGGMRDASRFATSRSASATSTRSTTSRVEVESGSLTALLGPTGSGKSTLLRVIAGLEPPDAGEIRLAGEDATALTPQKRGVGFVFQHYAAFKHMTVRDNIAFGLKIRKRPKAEIRAASTSCSSSCSSQGFGDRYPSQLSGGQRQRMALARALAPEPKVLLLDEPFGALDARVRAELRVWLRRLHDETHTTTVFVTHDQEEAMEVADNVVVMNQRPRRAGRRPARAVRPARERVRDDVRRPGEPLRRHHGCGRTTSSSLLEPNDATREAMVERVVAPRLRGAGRARARRRRAVRGAADARRGRAPRARARPDRLRAADARDDVRVDCLVRRPGVRVGGERLRPARVARRARGRRA